MRFIHRYGFAASRALERAELAMAGVTIPVGTGLIEVFTLAEDDARWPAVAEWAARHGITSMVSTEFSRAELDSAAWLNLRSQWFHGYPQPDDDFGYLSVTYDLTDYCERCGAGTRQNAPFRLRGEPKWGRRNIMQTYWVYDQFFVQPETFAAVFEPLGFQAKEVLSRGGRRLESVLQLVIEDVVPVAAGGHRHEPDCSVCGRRKYLPVVRGHFPMPVAELPGPAARTREWFGSGAEARQEVLVPQAVRRALMAGGVRGIVFKPCGPLAKSAPVAMRPVHQRPQQT